MADLVKFLVSNQENLEGLNKVKGQVIITLDTSNAALATRLQTARTINGTTSIGASSRQALYN